MKHIARIAKTMMRAIAISIIGAALFKPCYANESIVGYAAVQKAQSLSGVIRDQAGVPIPQVAVEEMSDD
jgi:hypothetical protein